MGWGRTEQTPPGEADKTGNGELIGWEISVKRKKDSY
jgi:hypothetical protein